MIEEASVDIDGRTLRYCLAGPPDGFPVVWHGGSPSSRWKRPDQLAAIERSGVRVLIPDRPGYGGSTRSPGRTVADVVPDVRALAAAQGWDRFAVLGGSGGGPHALACAALLPDRVVRCAVLSGIKPSEPAEAPGEPALRSKADKIARAILAGIADGGPEVPGDPPGPPARDDPAAMARLRATFTDSQDGWVDDTLAFARPWGFAMPDGAVPVGVWYGSDDRNVGPEHPRWLLANIPGARGHRYTGGHLPGPDTYQEIYGWLRS